MTWGMSSRPSRNEGSLHTPWSRAMSRQRPLVSKRLSRAVLSFDMGKNSLWGVGNERGSGQRGDVALRRGVDQPQGVVAQFDRAGAGVLDGLLAHARAA